MKYLDLCHMQAKEIQIVSFNTPFPPNYGGVIDVFYKIKALHHLGIKVHLHTFYDDRHKVDDLQPFCETIHLYKRNKSLLKHFSLLPYAISSRTSNILIERLISNPVPILFESIKSIYPLCQTKFSQKVGIRCQNIEHLYTYGLFKSEKNWLKKLAYFIESRKLNQVQNVLEKADVLLTISNEEQHYFSSNFKAISKLLPVFHGHTEIKSKPGYGKYALYHGDLSIADNIKSALFIISIFKSTEHQLIIASSTFPKVIKEAIKGFKNITFEVIKTEQQLSLLIENVQINTLYSFQQSGTKLKVFNALFNGRHCLINSNMVDDPKILNICKVAESQADYKLAVNELFKQEFKLDHPRVEALKHYNDIENAEILVKELLS